MFHGLGKLVNSEKTIFVGQFRNNDLNGKASETRSDGYIYNGLFKDGCHHGKGVEKLADGS